MDSPSTDHGALDNELDPQPEDVAGAEQQSSGAKRRRIARACDLCRKKKIKCDGKMPSCSHCQNSRSECVFTVVEKKRNPPKGAKYIEGLENRLRRMESLLHMTGIAADDTPESGTPENGNSFRKDSSSPEATPETRPGAESESLHGAAINSESQKKANKDASHDTQIEALSEMMCSLVTDNQGTYRYIGSSAGFSIFSPRGIEWVNEQVGDNTFAEVVIKNRQNTPFSYMGSPYFSGVFTRRIFQPLPSRQEVYSLAADYFNHFNFCVPLFCEVAFMRQLESHYSSNPPKCSSWWACLNIVLAIGYRLRIFSRVGAPDSEARSRGHFKNALAVSTELSTISMGLLSVQALLGMAIYIQGTSRVQSSFFLLSSAIRVAHSIGLHKRGSSFGIPPAEAEQRRRVFWIAYSLDKDLSLRAGWPPVIDDDDISIEMPLKESPDNAGMACLKDGGTVNLFYGIVRLSQIQSKIYRGLYTVKASRQTANQLVETLGSLDDELEAWKMTIPPEYRPSKDYVPQACDPFAFHVSFLHLVYYSCVSSIHRVGINQAFWSSKFGSLALASSSRPINPRVLNGADICVEASRLTINLMKRMAPIDPSCLWMTLYFPVSAMATLFVHILQNPHDPMARSDLKLMNAVIGILQQLTEGPDEDHGKKLLVVCLHLERLSRNFLERHERGSRNGTRKRKNSNSWADNPVHPSVEMVVPSGAAVRHSDVKGGGAAGVGVNGFPGGSETVSGFGIEGGSKPVSRPGGVATGVSTIADAPGFSENVPISSFMKTNMDPFSVGVLPGDVINLPDSENWLVPVPSSKQPFGVSQVNTNGGAGPGVFGGGVGNPVFLGLPGGSKVGPNGGGGGGVASAGGLNGPASSQPNVLDNNLSFLHAMGLGPMEGGGNILFNPAAFLSGSSLSAGGMAGNVSSGASGGGAGGAGPVAVGPGHQPQPGMVGADSDAITGAFPGPNDAASTLSGLWQMPLMEDWDWGSAIASAAGADGSGMGLDFGLGMDMGLGTSVDGDGDGKKGRTGAGGDDGPGRGGSISLRGEGPIGRVSGPGGLVSPGSAMVPVLPDMSVD